MKSLQKMRNRRMSGNYRRRSLRRESLSGRYRFGNMEEEIEEVDDEIPEEERRVGSDMYVQFFL